MTDQAVAKRESLTLRLDPQTLLATAVEKGAGVDTLERLLAMAKEVRAEQAREAWHQAMAEFQRRCPDIVKNKTAEVATVRGFYKYRYAALDSIMEAVRPLAGELGLVITWETEVDGTRVVAQCHVAHVQGYSQSSGKVSLPVPDSSERGGGNSQQRVGSTLTYARRYSLLNITGLTPEDDDDAQGAGAQKQTTKSPAAPVTQPEKATEPESLPAPSGDPPPMTTPMYSVDKWRALYAATETGEQFDKLEQEMGEVWAGYENEEKGILKGIRDVNRARVKPQPGASKEKARQQAQQQKLV